MLTNNTNLLIDALQESEAALDKPEQWFFSCTILSNILNEQGQSELSYLWKSLARQTDMSRATYHILVGATYIQLENWEQAIHHNKEAITIDKNLALAYSNLAKLYDKLGQPEEGLEYRYKFMSLRPDQTSAANCEELGNTLLNQGQAANAIDCYQRAIHNNPEQWTAYYRIAHILTCANQIERAIRYYQLLLDRNPSQIEAHQKLGKLLLEQQQYQEAIKHFQTAIIQKPDFTLAHLGLARGLLALSKWDDAIEHFKIVISQKPDLTWAYLGLARGYLGSGKWDDAIEHFKIVISQKPDLTWAYLGLARGYLALKQWDSTIEACQQALNFDGEHLQFYRYMAKALLAQGRLSEAKTCWQKIAVLEGWEEYRYREYEFTNDSFTHQISLWVEQLRTGLNIAPQRKPLSVLQIGGGQGMWSCWMLDRILTQREDRLFCLAHPLSHEFQSNLKKAQPKCSVICPGEEPEETLSALKTEQAASYDLIYVQNRCDNMQLIYESAYSIWPLLRTGGLMAFQNYLMSPPEHSTSSSTKAEIESFLSEIEGEFKILHKKEQLFIKKEESFSKSTH